MIAAIAEKIVPAIVAIDGFHMPPAIAEKVSRGPGSDNIIRAILQIKKIRLVFNSASAIANHDVSTASLPESDL